MERGSSCEKCLRGSPVSHDLTQSHVREYLFLNFRDFLLPRKAAKRGVWEGGRGERDRMRGKNERRTERKEGRRMLL